MSSTTSSSDPAPEPPKAAPTPEERRAGMRAAIEAGVAKLPALPQTLEEFDIHIPVRDGWKSRTKVVRPKSEVDAPRPLIVDFFGGAMIVGEPEQLLNVARAYADKYGAVVALPSYRLVPDVRWPVPYQDGWDVVVWLSNHAESELGANLDAGFIVGGASAGGAVAAVCGGLAMFPDAKEAQDAPKLARPLTGQMILIAGLVVEEVVPAEFREIFTSREDNKDAAGLDTATLDLIMQGLMVTDYSSLWYSPLSTLYKRPPVNKIPTYLESCGLDPLRDDTTLYAKVLESKGVPIKSHLFPEDAHYSWTVMVGSPKAKDPTFEEAQMEGMKWLLSQTPIIQK